PVGLIAPLYRADENEFARLLAPISEYARARIAAYCVERDNLHALALKIAGTCEEATLIKAAGAEIGAALFTQSRIAEASRPVPAAVPEPVSTPMQIIDFSVASHEQERPECPRAA
ncbi:hypothetical protein, partial [Methylobacterium nigriterrae]|uniref:hypothetical protein n=1 Tax=Methylobacterium nigriterrae TaxID=3127512 RepID=UPI0030139E16